MTATTPVRMVRACAPNLAQGHLVSSVIAGKWGERAYMGGRNRCPQHDDPTRPLSTPGTGACLDSFWSQRYLSSLSLVKAARLWWGWRKAARR
jgi:hypothetical protein